ncbi:MAG: hypothetical protein JWM10_4168, partial [Myxococcaceae bacterium]|nr:hypothetical protein [Myxococcaceae bacterium]
AREGRSIAATARKLGIARSTLRDRMRRHGISVSTSS